MLLIFDGIFVFCFRFWFVFVFLVCDTPGFLVCGVFFVYFLLVLGWVFGLVLVFVLFFRVFDTPVFWLVFNGFVVFAGGGFAFGCCLV
ncbi:hypothetical protein [Gardnerella sp. 2492-Sm]|uniref:hypothetical protein n=1 Tax=unclassified Gardnerella TaxID=2628112 RepID=UPI003D0197E0